jgi:hypothetical protein
MVLGSVVGANTAINNVNVGITETNPRFPLSFGAAIGDKISLWSNSANSYGFSIQSSLLQIHRHILCRYCFWLWKFGSFAENFRVKEMEMFHGMSTGAAALTFGQSLSKK